MVLQSGGLCMTYGDRYGGAQPTWHTLSPPARVPQHHPASQALGRSPSSRLWQGASSSWSAQGVLSLIPTSSGTGRAPCYRYL